MRLAGSGWTARLAALWLGLLTLPGLLAAQAAPSQAELSWHVVRPGETLEGITARYLGSSQRWRENHRLNPGIANPNLLQPGQRLRVLVQATSAGPAARVERLAAKVEDLPQPFTWRSALAGDLLIEDDGLRTFERASAEVRFTDGTSILATESSLLFLRRPGQPAAPAVDRAIEIVRGSADLETPGGDLRRPKIEVVLGKIRATSAGDREGAARSRARRPEDGGAKVMIYRGEGEVEAAGERVAVPQGMGSSVPDAGPPSPPEPLLPAPAALEPPEAARLLCSRALLRWEAVPGAASYLAEICRDPRCAELVLRATGLGTPEWRPELPAETLYWRATAVSARGLDGYPGAARSLTVAGTAADLAPPTGELALVGSTVSTGGTLWARQDVRVEAAAEDVGTGVALVAWNVDGAEAAAAPGVLPAGPHTVGAVAEDGCGNRATLAPVAFTVDDAPPSIRWEARPRTGGAEGGRRGTWRSVSHLQWRERWSVLYWDDAVAWREARGLPRPDGLGDDLPLTWQVPSSRPEVTLTSRRARPFADSAPVQIESGEELHLWAEDTGCGLATLTVRQVRTPEVPGLEVEAIDRLGHTSKQLLPLAGDERSARR